MLTETTTNALDLIPNAANLDVLDLPPGSPEWHDARQQGIGGSEVAALIGASPWATRYSVWRDKMGLDPVGKPSWKMEQGTALEDTIARRWAESVGATLYRVPMLVDREHPWRRVNLDRIARMPEGSVVPVEIKWTDSIGDEVPTHYLCQILFQLGMTGLTHAFLVHANTWNEPAALPVTARPDLYGGIVATVDAFWTEHVLTGVAPDPSTPDERLTVAFDKLRGSDALADADETAEGIRARLADAKARGAEAEADEKAARADLADWLAAHGAVKCKGKGWTASVITKAGAVSYKAACEAHGITDLERFRGQGSTYLDVRNSKSKEV